MRNGWRSIVLLFPLVLALSVIPEKGEPANFRFVAWGDTKLGTPVLQAMSPYVVAKSPVFDIFLGDLEETGFTTSGIENWKAALNGGVGNGLFDKTFALRGNHDSRNLSGWQGYFDFPGVATTVGATNYSVYTTDTVYSFDYGNSHFIILDAPGDIDALSPAQVTWMNTDLTSAESRGMVHAFVHIHAPPYCGSSGQCRYATILGDDAPAAFWTAINDHPIVTAIFAGHEHLLSRTLLDDARIPALTRTVEQFVSGAAGAVSVDPAPCDHTNRWSWCDAVDGYATVDVSGRTVTVNFYRETTSTPIATYVITKSIVDNAARIPEPTSDIFVP